MQTSVSYLPTRRDAASKTRLLEAGVRLFTRNAGHGLTAREVAREAKVNHALISYHFGGAPKLLDAVAEQCIQDLRAMLLPAIEHFTAHLGEANSITTQAGKEQPPTLLEHYVEDLLQTLSGPKGQTLLKALTGSNISSLQGAYERFSQHVLQPLHQSFVMAAAKHKGISEQSLEASVLAQLMLAQIMAFFRGGGLVLAHLEKKSFTQEEIREISHITAQSLCRIVGF